MTGLRNVALARRCCSDLVECADRGQGTARAAPCSAPERRREESASARSRCTSASAARPHIHTLELRGEPGSNGPARTSLLAALQPLFPHARAPGRLQAGCASSPRGFWWPSALAAQAAPNRALSARPAQSTEPTARRERSTMPRAGQEPAAASAVAAAPDVEPPRAEAGAAEEASKTLADRLNSARPAACARLLSIWGALAACLALPALARDRPARAAHQP